MNEATEIIPMLNFEPQIDLRAVFLQLERQVAELSFEDPDPRRGNENLFLTKREELLQRTCTGLTESQARRIRDEFDGWGPLTDLFARKNLTEILVNSATSIWFEEDGQLKPCVDFFLSEHSHQRIVERVAQESGAHATIEQPSANGRWRDFRVHFLRAPLTKEHGVLCLRRHPENPWTLGKLREAGWCTIAEQEFLCSMVRERKNFLVIGATGCGKTSVVNALLREFTREERAVVIEDTDEIALPGGPSVKLLTRAQSSGGMPAIDQGELVRQSLRMRPDRLVMGEVRGDEAKDFLMALSTGHAGSFGTLHADDPAQALIRLEMLVQMGAPDWSLSAIRKLIRFGIQQIIVTGKKKNGERSLLGIHRLVSLEETGFLLEKVDPEKGPRA